MYNYSQEEIDRSLSEIGISADTATVLDIIPAYVRAMAIMETVDLACKNLNTDSPVPNCLRTKFRHNRKKPE